MPNSDPRTNPAVKSPPPREPIRNALIYVGALVVVALTALVTLQVISLEQLTLVGATAASIWVLVFGFMERVRAQVNSPATSAHNAELRDALAQAIVLAEKNGTVPPVGKTLAESVIAGGIKGAATPALQAAALALGLPHAFVVAAAPAALQAAMDAVTGAVKRAPTQQELNDRVTGDL